MSKTKQPKWMTDESCFWHPKNRLTFLIAGIVVMLIGAAVFAFCFSIAFDYMTAPYKEEVEAKLVDIKEGVTEKWEYTESKEEARDPNKRATRTYRESIYSYHWKYYINDKPYIWETTESSGTAHKIGDTMNMKFWSADGEEYHRSWTGAVNNVLIFVAGVVTAVALLLILRIIISMIQTAIWNAGKKKRREEAENSFHGFNLQRHDGKTVRITDTAGEIFEGVCEYINSEYCEHEYGVNEDALEIVNFVFYRSNIAKLETIDKHEGAYGCFDQPFGKIEETNYQDGIDCIKDVLFDEAEVHVLRMLRCLEVHKAELSDEIKEAVKELSKTTGSTEIKEAAEKILS